MIRVAPVFLLLLFGCLSAESFGIEGAPCADDLRCPTGTTCCASTNACLADDGYCPPNPCGQCSSGESCCESIGICLSDSALCADQQLRLTSVSPSSGPRAGGVLLRLAGQGFSEGMTVYVGSASCELHTVEPNRAECWLPEAYGDYRPLPVSLVSSSGTAVLQHAYQYWAPPLIDRWQNSGLVEAGFGVSLALFDLDHDERLDVVFASAEAPGLRLFRQARPMRFEAATAQAGLGVSRPSGHVTTADIDGDGLPDLISVLQSPLAEGSLQLWMGASSGPGSLRFVRGAAVGAGTWRSSEAIDLNGDRRIDILGCRFPDVSDPSMLGVLVQQSDGSFTESGEIVVDGSRSREYERNGCESAALGDFDSDGDADLAVCNDFLALFRNDSVPGGPVRLVDISEEAGLRALQGPCAHTTWVDFDDDGDLDLGSMVRELRGTILLRNDEGQFSPIGRSAALALHEDVCLGSRLSDENLSLPLGGKNALWIDVDHDADVDLFIPALEVQGIGCQLPPQLYYNQLRETGRLGFIREDMLDAPAFASAGAGVGDLDRDGDLDVMLATWANPFHNRYGLLESTAADRALPDPEIRGAHLIVEAVTECVGPTSSARCAARGAVVELDLDDPKEPDFAPGHGRRAIRMVGGAGLGSSRSEPVAHFVVPPSVSSLAMRVRFPSGASVVQTVDGFDQRLIVYEPR